MWTYTTAWVNVDTSVLHLKRQETAWKFHPSTVLFLWSVAALCHAKILFVFCVCWRLLPLCSHCVLKDINCECIWKSVKVVEFKDQPQSFQVQRDPDSLLPLPSLSSLILGSHWRATYWAYGSLWWDAHTPCPTTATCSSPPLARQLQHSF